MTVLVPLVLIGCGGHASDVLSVIEACNAMEHRYRVLGYLDDNRDADDWRVASRGITRLGCIDDAKDIDAFCVLGIGYPGHRSGVVRRLQELASLAEPLVHPQAQLSTGVNLETGVVIFGGAQVGPLAQISLGAMVGRSAIIGHDTAISRLVSVMPGAVVSGECSVGVEALIGSNATVLEGRVVGARSQLGAGAVLTSDLAAGCTAVGVPARVVGRCR